MNREEWENDNHFTTWMIAIAIIMIAAGIIAVAGAWGMIAVGAVFLIIGSFYLRHLKSIEPKSEEK